MLLRRSDSLPLKHKVTICIFKIKMHNENMLVGNKLRGITRANPLKGGDAKLPGFAG